MNHLKECQRYIKDWYINGHVVTVKMDDNHPMDELCIQTMVVELLRDFIDNPIPEGMAEGSQALNEWVDFGFRKVMHGLDFGFSQEQESQVKNLAFNYYIQGINRVLRDPTLAGRIYKCHRKQQVQQ